MLRRRMQTSGSVNQYGTAHGLFTSNSDVRRRPMTNNSALLPTMSETLQMILEEQGVRGLFKGLSMNWVKVTSLALLCTTIPPIPALRMFPDHILSGTHKYKSILHCV